MSVVLPLVKHLLFYRSGQLLSQFSVPCSEFGKYSSVSNSGNSTLRSSHTNLRSKTAYFGWHGSEPSQINLAEKNVTSQGAEQSTNRPSRHKFCLASPKVDSDFPSGRLNDRLGSDWQQWWLPSIWISTLRNDINNESSGCG
ncbi:hypothetical protein ASPFODRAFT_72013 [Aspergillus luchuensis CBS 106.47]|uniref:Uncharacterized protein n=1 Tax=Aspergillus luchuensis (strain CBS 106.47) TaxID=1137211 RepID=A0A1M3TDZ3_ASPLC|nr:hypothetical protein ASPFODRAFT_72013 [Aspergillus luchuensis CBS 106.47]